MSAHIKIGETVYPLTLQRGYNPATGKNDGMAHRFWATLAVNDRAYAYAEVQVVHEHGCRATRLGVGYEPCDCGGDDLFRDLLTAAGESYEGSYSPAPAAAPEKEAQGGE